MKALGSILILLATFTLCAQEPVESNKSGQDLAAKLCSLAPPANAQMTGVMNIRRRGQGFEQVPLLTKVNLGNPGWEAIYQTRPTEKRPAERLIIRHAPNKPNEYLLGRGSHVEDPQPVGKDQLAMPFGGSDFWLMDLGLDFLHWPVQHLIKLEKPDMRKSRPCDRLESQNPMAPPGAYSRVVSFIDKETGGLIVAEAYDAQNKIIKSFSVVSVKKVQGEYQLNEMEMEDRRAGSRTRIDFDVERGKQVP
ncbi:MAG: hypothetical protein JWM16_103 [Verrucomicrobiales bacterium]|nr:hypothetical protein [Verrucomicrobiales bacterium]